MMMTPLQQIISRRIDLAIAAEKAGRQAADDCHTHEAAEKRARQLYPCGLEQECFVAGWNSARWQQLARCEG